MCDFKSVFSNLNGGKKKSALIYGMHQCQEFGACVITKLVFAINIMFKLRTAHPWRWGLGTRLDTGFRVWSILP
jgi:hypothetical protein